MTLAFALLISCGGGLDITPGGGPAADAGNNQQPDMGSIGPDGGLPVTRIPDAGQPDGSTPMVDMAVPDEDMSGPPPVCDPADCGPGASCQDNLCTCDDGLLGDPFTGCSATNPCEDAMCPAGSSCNPDGSCSCDPFFTGDPVTGCEPMPAPADPAARTSAEVCAIWTDQYSRSSNDFFLIEPADVCDPGVMHPDELRTALHATSRYRMMVGLHPVSLAAGALDSTQECAMMHAANNAGLNHEPPQSWDCYTQVGFGGCSSSNLARGIGQPAPTVALYIQDNMVPSLGHRRWIFNPRMGATAFGHRGSFGAMYAFDGSRNHNPPFVAYPAPGPFPRDAITGKWSIHGGANYQGDFAVTVTNMSDGSAVAVSDITAPVFGNLASTLSWRVSTNQLPIDTTYRITIEDSGGAVVQQYDTTLIDCP